MQVEHDYDEDGEIAYTEVFLTGSDLRKLELGQEISTSGVKISVHFEQEIEHRTNQVVNNPNSW
jgi:hypothetical protein